MPKLQQLEICGFRAFGTPQTFSFESDLAVIWGFNSQGKTSVAEAVEFLLTGATIRRDMLGGAKAEHEGSLRNVHRSVGDPVWVRATILDEAGNAHEAVRTLVTDYTAEADCQSTLTIDGNAAADLTPPRTDSLRDDLKEWRKVSDGKSAALVFPRSDGEPWNETDYRNWRRRVYRPLGETVGIEKAQPYELRHSFASLLFQEGKTNHVDIAAQMGHNLQTLYSTYTHTIEELRDTPRQPVETLIRTARKKVASERAAPILPQSTRTKKK